MIMLIATALLVFSICLWLTSGRTPLAIKDHPNERSLHATPMPHTGGLAMLAGIGMAWAWCAGQHGWPAALTWMVFPLLLVATVSFLDDVRSLPALLRLVVHGIAAFVLVYGGFTLPGTLGAVVSWFAIVWMMNLYNFMDGVDGLAGGMAVFGFAFLGLAGWLSGHMEYAQFVWVIAASALGFLIPNLPPARIFMGDAGAVTLGMLAAAFSLWGVHDHVFPIWFPVLVFSPFIVDATVTLIRRALRREKIWQAHREHYYQRLVLLGWGHRKTLLAEYVLMLGCGVSALAMQMQPAWIVPGITLWIVSFAGIAWIVDQRWRVFSAQVDDVGNS